MGGFGLQDLGIDAPVNSSNHPCPATAVRALGKSTIRTDTLPGLERKNPRENCDLRRAAMQSCGYDRNATGMRFISRCIVILCKVAKALMRGSGELPIMRGNLADPFQRP